MSTKQQQPANVNVFVYGSLRRGRALHAHLRDCPFVGVARVFGYDLYDLGHFPTAVPDAPPSHFIVGEVYTVDALTLRMLDRVEGGYTRVTETAALLDNTPVVVELYLWLGGRTDFLRRIESGDWNKL